MRIQFVLCLPLLTAAGWAQAPTPTPPIMISRSLTFAPVGVATSETIQMNVANTASNSANATASCSGAISFNVSGAKTQPSQVKFTVTAGEIFSTSLAWESLGVTGRAEVLGSIQFTQAIGTPCALSASLETYDTMSGVTHSFQSNAASNGPVVVAEAAH